MGCSGWNYADWRGLLYERGLPTGRWLERYAERFDTVELNASFYRLVRPANAARWVEQTPPDFVFAAKASRFLTHMKRLADIEQGVERFSEGIAPLAESGKLGPVVWQLPERFHRDDDRLARALDLLPPGQHAWEFRHPSWFESGEVLELLRWHGCALVIGHHPQRPFQPLIRTAGWTLVRFHHGARGHRGNYSETELLEWAERLRGWSGFAYFNNDWEGFAVRNAARFERALAAGPAARRGPVARPV